MVRERIRVMQPAEPSAPKSQIDSVCEQVTSSFGANVLRRATAVPGFNQVETGIFILDLALLGGIPEGLVTMLYGLESSGKSTLADRVMARIQRKYPQKVVLKIDCEHAHDNKWSEKHGVDNSRLILCQPESGEQAVDVLDAVMRTPECAGVIIDSLPTLIPQKEADASVSDDFYAIRSKLIGRMCSKILHAMTDSRHKHGLSPTTILINQYRAKIGGNPHSSPYVLPGGYQPKYLSQTMIELKNFEHKEMNERKIEIVSYNEHSFTLKKSRIGNSLRQGSFNMVRDPSHRLGEGAIDETEAVATFAKKFGLITGGGASWRIADVDQKFGNLAAMVEYLEAQPEMYRDMKRRILITQRTEMGLLPLPPDNYLYGFCDLER